MEQCCSSYSSEHLPVEHVALDGVAEEYEPSARTLGSTTTPGSRRSLQEELGNDEPSLRIPASRRTHGGPRSFQEFEWAEHITGLAQVSLGVVKSAESPKSLWAEVKMRLTPVPNYLDDDEDLKQSQGSVDNSDDMDDDILPDSNGTALLGEKNARRSSEGIDAWTHHKQDWLIGTRLGTTTLFIVLFVFLLLVGGLVFHEAMQDEGIGELGVIDGTFEESMWLSWGLFFDPGTQTGVPPWATLRLKTWALIFSVCGFLFNLVFLGLVVDGVKSGVDYIATVHGRVVQNNHILILGWGDQGLVLLRELVGAYQEGSQHVKSRTCCLRRKRAIVILSSYSATEVLNTIHHQVHRSGKSSLLARFTIEVRQGDPADWKEMKKVSVFSADKILILKSERDKSTSDLQVTQCLLGLTALHCAKTEPDITAEVFAEVQNPENLPLVDAMVDAKGIMLRGTAVRMMCQHCFYPEVGQALQRMVSSRSDHIYVVPLPDNARGKEFLDVNDLYPEAVLIGVKEAVDGDPARSLVFISRKDPIQEDRLLPHRRHRIEEPPSPQRSPAANTEADHTTSFDPKNLLLRGKESANKRDTVIVIGAPSDLVTFITNLKRYAQFAGGAKGSDFKIHVLCREKKAFSFLEGDGSRKVTLQEGDTSAPRDLQTLPLKEAFSIMVLAYRNSDDESFAAVDARSLTTVFQLDHLLDEQRRSGENIDEFKVALMCELQDPQSETVVQMNPVFSRSAYFFHSLHMESGLFAAAVCDIKAFNCLMTLLEQNGLDMRCERATAVAPHASVPTSFKKLQKDIHEKDNSLLLIGWKNVDDDPHSPLEANQWQINPEDKVTTFPLKDDSLLLILRNKDAADLARRVASRPESENLDIGHRRSLISSGPSFGAVGRWHLPSRIM